MDLLLLFVLLFVIKKNNFFIYFYMPNILLAKIVNLKSLATTWKNNILNGQIS